MTMVCSCHVVSERRIARAIDRGACTVAEVTRACGAGATCHGCHDAIEGLVRLRQMRDAVSVAVARAGAA